MVADSNLAQHIKPDPAPETNAAASLALEFAMTFKPPMRHLVRPMTPHDIRQVAGIERECFPTGWVPTPFRRELQNHSAAYLVACRTRDPNNALTEARTALLRPPGPDQGLVSKLLTRFRGAISTNDVPDTYPEDREVVGFAGLWFVADEAHLAVIGVRETDRGQGIGELLLLASAEFSLPKQARVMTLEVRASNEGAQNLYKKYGFEAIGLRKGYYTDNDEDAVIMTTDAVCEAPFQQRLERLRQAHEEQWGPSVRLLVLGA